MATSKDVAELAGVHRTTVSAIMNGRAEELRIAPDTIRRVQEAATKLNYNRTYHAQCLQQGKSMCIAYVSFRQTPAARQLRAKLGRETAKHGMLLTLPTINANQTQADPYEQLLSALNGIQTGCYDQIIVDCDYDSVFSDTLRAMQGKLANRLIAINVHGSFDLPHLNINFDRALGMAFNHLKQHGHSLLACCCSIACMQRLSAGDKGEHLSALAQRHGIKVSYYPLESDETLCELARGLQGKTENPSAFLVDDTAHALALIDLFREQGRDIPTDYSLISSDDDNASMADPPLAAISEEPQALARSIMPSLLQPSKPLRRIFADFIPRDSIGRTEH